MPTKNSLPIFRAALVDPAGFVSLAWLPWFNQLQNAGADLAAAGVSLASLQTAVKADAGNVAVLTREVTAAQAAVAASLASLQTLQDALAQVAQTQNVQTLELAQHQARLDGDDAAIAAVNAAIAAISVSAQANRSVEINGVAYSDDFDYFVNRTKQVLVNGV